MLWRRSKLGLYLTALQVEELAAFMRAVRSAAAQHAAGAHA
jgi:hypothetical protein